MGAKYLVVNICSRNRNCRTSSNVKPIRIRTQTIACSAINRDSRNGEISTIVDAENLHRWVENVDIGDGG
jgi:hypothetical protein